MFPSYLLFTDARAFAWLPSCGVHTPHSRAVPGTVRQNIRGPSYPLTFSTYLKSWGLKFLRAVRICLASKRVSMDRVNTNTAGLWVRGAGLGTAATATVYWVCLPTPAGGHGKSPQNVHQGLSSLLYLKHCSRDAQYLLLMTEDGHFSHKVKGI